MRQQQNAYPEKSQQYWQVQCHQFLSSCFCKTDSEMIDNTKYKRYKTVHTSHSVSDSEEQDYRAT